MRHDAVSILLRRSREARRFAIQESFTSGAADKAISNVWSTIKLNHTWILIFHLML